MPRHHRLIASFICVVSLILGGCGKSKTPQTQTTPNSTAPNASPSPSNPSATFSVVGRWASGCQVDSEWYYGNYGYKSVLEFTASEVTETLTYYYDESCTEQWGDPEQPRSTYTVGADVSGQSSTKELNLASELPDVRPYQIVRVSGNELTLGDTSSRDGRSAAARPNTLNTAIRFVK